MKKTLLLSALLAIMGIPATAQLNLELQSQLAYERDANDIWGWTSPETGIEYALVGLLDGLSIVSLEDKENPVEVARIPGDTSTWRDIKTWKSFAYVTTDQSGTNEGVTVIDLSNLPESAPFYRWRPAVGDFDELRTCHNIYIDESGYAYLAGCNINNGGMLILNVDTPTGEPEYVAAGPPVYAHDVYVMNGHMYASELFEGQMAIYDVSDKQNLQLLGTQPTPFSFTHNIWVNDDETVAFTTDEVANAPVAAYDITDFGEIEELDQYRPAATLGSGVIPHNVHVWNDYLLISYYTDGAKIVDASRPSNLIEVGSFDTWLGPDGGFNGAWGLFPYFPSRTVAVSDINNGLYVLEPTFKRACWLEGIVRDSSTGALLSEVEVVIDSDQPNFATTNAFGKFESGQVLSGTFEVTFSKLGYEDKTITVDLQNGQLTEVEVEMAAVPRYALSIISEDEQGNPIPGAQVRLENSLFQLAAQTDSSGQLLLENVYEGTYNLGAAAWGYEQQIRAVELLEDDALTLVMAEGYQDDFAFDLGWETDADTTVTSGFWERGIPRGTSFFGNLANPGADAPGDFGNQCYVTGNAGGGAGTDDLDNGQVVLRSPYMDLSEYENPMLSLSYWFYNDGGEPPINDTLDIAISSPEGEALLVQIDSSASAWRRLDSFKLGGVLELRDSMRLIVRTEDLPASGHLVEAAVDRFRLIDSTEVVSEVEEAALQPVYFRVFPNPSTDQFTVAYELPKGVERGELWLHNAQGQLLRQTRVTGQAGQLQLGNDLRAGLYFLRITAAGQLLQSRKIIKAGE